MWVAILWLVRNQLENEYGLMSSKATKIAERDRAVPTDMAIEDMEKEAAATMGLVAADMGPEYQLRADRGAAGEDALSELLAAPHRPELTESSKPAVPGKEDESQDTMEDDDEATLEVAPLDDERLAEQ